MTGGKIDSLILLVIGCASVFLFALTVGGLGVNVDEMPYILAGKSYVQSLGDAVKPNPIPFHQRMDHLDAAFAQNKEHPPVAKYAYGFFGLLFGKILDPVTASRIGGLAFLLVLQAALYRFLSKRYGALAGLLAALAVLSHPRLLYHSFTCGLDMPVAAMSVLCAVLFVEGIERRGAAALCGIVWGLALATKNNGVFLIVPLAIWGYAFHRRKVADNLFFMAILGPLTFLAVWPWIWRDTFARLLEYFQFHAHHKFEPVYYFGAVYSVHPRSYAAAAVLAVTPLAIWLAAAASLLRLRIRPVDDVFVLILGLGLFPVLMFSLASVPAYNDERLLLLGLVMFCVLAGIGAARIWEMLQAKIACPPRSRISAVLRNPRVSVALVGAFLLLPGFIGAAETHPYESGYFGGLAGFRTGAVALGFNPMPWSQVPMPVVRQLEEKLPENATLDDNSGAATVLKGLQSLDLFRKDIRIVPQGEFWLIESNFAYSGFEQYWSLWYDVDRKYELLRSFEGGGVKYLSLMKRLPPGTCR